MSHLEKNEIIFLLIVRENLKQSVRVIMVSICVMIVLVLYKKVIVFQFPISLIMASGRGVLEVDPRMKKSFVNGEEMRFSYHDVVPVQAILTVNQMFVMEESVNNG